MDFGRISDGFRMDLQSLFLDFFVKGKIIVKILKFSCVSKLFSGFFCKKISFFGRNSTEIRPKSIRNPSEISPKFGRNSAEIRLNFGWISVKFRMDFKNFFKF